MSHNMNLFPKVSAVSEHYREVHISDCSVHLNVFPRPQVPTLGVVAVGAERTVAVYPYLR